MVFLKFLFFILPSLVGFLRITYSLYIVIIGNVRNSYMLNLLVLVKFESVLFFCHRKDPGYIRRSQHDSQNIKDDVSSNLAVQTKKKVWKQKNEENQN